MRLLRSSKYSKQSSKISLRVKAIVKSILETFLNISDETKRECFDDLISMDELWVKNNFWCRIYIELDQFTTDITQEMVEVKFEEQSCSIRIVDEVS